MPTGKSRFKGSTWHRKTKELNESQLRICALCLASKPKLDAAHIEPLGMGRSRFNDECPLNLPSNLLGLCRQCHGLFDSWKLDVRKVNGPRLKAVVLELVEKLKADG